MVCIFLGGMTDVSQWKKQRLFGLAVTRWDCINAHVSRQLGINARDLSSPLFYNYANEDRKYKYKTHPKGNIS